MDSLMLAQGGKFCVVNFCARNDASFKQKPTVFPSIRLRNQTYLMSVSDLMKNLHHNQDYTHTLLWNRQTTNI